MKQTQTRSSRAAALLLAAAALPFTPAFAQDVQPEPVTAAPPVAETIPPAPAPTPAPVVDTIPEPTPAPQSAAPPAASAAPAPAPRAAATRTPARAATRQAPVRTVAAAAPAAAAPAALPEPAPAEALPPEAMPEAIALPPAPAAETPAPVEESTGGNTTLWVVAGLLLLGALGALFLLMRRRRRDEAVYDDYRTDAYEEPRYDTAMSSAAAMPEAAGIPLAAAPIAVAAAATETGRPHLDIALHPRRAGVTGTEAKVEFELEIDNQGNAAAEDVRISTWMLPAGAGNDMESALIVRDGDAAPTAELPAIPAGSEERISHEVALPTSEVASDALLPVVVAEARYRLPDGSEARTTASFAVGVPDGEEFAHFAIDNPSGLHEGVEARQLGEPEHV